MRSDPAPTTATASTPSATAGASAASGLGEPLGLAAAGVAGLATVGLVFPRTGSPLPACPSLTLFGVYCPLCGATRSVYALAEGDLSAMVSSNAFTPILLLLSVWAWSTWTARRAGWRWVPAIPWPRVVAASLAILAVVYGVLRNLPGEPWSLLAP